MFAMKSSHPLNDEIHTYIKLKDLEIGRKYKVHSFGMFRGNVAKIERMCPTVEIDDSYLILCEPERYQEVIKNFKLENISPLYIAYCGPGKRSRPEFHFYDHLWNIIV